jgi:hypothetical protein
MRNDQSCVGVKRLKHVGRFLAFHTPFSATRPGAHIERKREEPTTIVVHLGRPGTNCSVMCMVTVSSGLARNYLYLEVKPAD